MEIKKGKAFKFGDGISTDHIAPGRLFHLRSNLEEFSKHVLEDADPDFAKNMKKATLSLREITSDWDLQENMPRRL